MSVEYQYQNLDEGQIRLLSFSHRRRGALDGYTPYGVRAPAYHTLEWSIRTVNLSDKIPYVALSYAWGDPDDKTTWSIGLSKFVWIPKSLSLALTYFSKKFKPVPVLIWADAICINQKNFAERTRQVGIMRQIFEDAATVWVWLGEAGAEETLAFRGLSKWQELGYLKLNRPIMDPLLIIRERLNSIAFWDFQELEAIQSFLKKPWWSRLWTLQEIILANSAYIVCGDHWLHWDDFKLIYGLWSDASLISSTELGLRGAMILSQLTMEVINVKTSFGRDRPGFIALLENTAFFDVTDPRDRINALAGIGSHLGFTADYNSSVEDAYITFGKSWVKESLTLSILKSAGLVEHPTQLTLPSWVPDWTIQRSRPAPLRFTIRFHQSSSPQLYRVIDGSDILRVEATIIDQVQAVGVQFDITNNQHQFFLDQWLNLLISQLPNFQDPLQGSRFLRDFYRTISYPPDANADVMRRRRFVAASRFAQGHGEALNMLLSKPAGTLNTPDLIFDLLQVDVLGYGEGLGQDYDSEVTHWIKYIIWICQYRRLYVTEKGFIGLGPPSVREGDSLCLIDSFDSVAILRRGGETWRFVGESYVERLVQRTKTADMDQHGIELIDIS